MVKVVLPVFILLPQICETGHSFSNIILFSLGHEDDDISEVESMDSQILVVKPEKKIEARQNEEDDRDEQSGSPHQNEEGDCKDLTFYCY